MPVDGAYLYIRAFTNGYVVNQGHADAPTRPGSFWFSLNDDSTYSRPSKRASEQASRQAGNQPGETQARSRASKRAHDTHVDRQSRAYLPPLQSVHASALMENLPVGQAVHDAAPAAEKVPSAQVRHENAPADEYLPAAQLRQSDAP
jgi:hypothetical protein